MRAHEHKFTCMDRTWKIEAAWLASIMGEECEEKLQAAFLDLLPTTTKAVQLDECTQNISILTSTKLHSLATVKAQHSLTPAIDMIHRMLNGFTPTVPKSPSRFITRVWERLPMFMRIEMESSGEHKKELIGAQAAKHILAKTLHKKDKVDMSMLEKLVIFRWLLTEDEQKKVDEMQEVAWQRHGKKLTATEEPVGSSSKRRKVAQSANAATGSSASDSISAAASMFKPSSTSSAQSSKRS